MERCHGEAPLHLQTPAACPVAPDNREDLNNIASPPRPARSGLWFKQSRHPSPACRPLRNCGGCLGGVLPPLPSCGHPASAPSCRAPAPPQGTEAAEAAERRIRFLGNNAGVRCGEEETRPTNESRSGKGVSGAFASLYFHFLTAQRDPSPPWQRRRRKQSSESSFSPKPSRMGPVQVQIQQEGRQEVAPPPPPRPYKKEKASQR